MDPIKSAIIDILRRLPWLTAREITRELAKEGLTGVSHKVVNHHLYASGKTFHNDGSMPPRWRTNSTIAVELLEEELPSLDSHDLGHRSPDDGP